MRHAATAAVWLSIAAIFRQPSIRHRLIWLVGIASSASSEIDAQAAVERRLLYEVLLDVVALVSERDVELAEPVVGVVHRDVPQDRAPADLDHRLGPHLGLLDEAGPDAAGEDRDLRG